MSLYTRARPGGARNRYELTANNVNDTDDRVSQKCDERQPSNATSFTIAPIEPPQTGLGWSDAYRSVTRAETERAGLSGSLLVAKRFLTVRLSEVQSFRVQLRHRLLFVGSASNIPYPIHVPVINIVKSMTSGPAIRPLKSFSPARKNGYQNQKAKAVPPTRPGADPKPGIDRQAAASSAPCSGRYYQVDAARASRRARSDVSVSTKEYHSL